MKRIIIAIIYIIPVSLYAQSDSLDIWTEKGITAFKNNNYKEAIKYFEYCTKDYERQQLEDGKYGSYLSLLAFCNAKLGDYSKAVEYEAKATEIKKTKLGENHPDYAASLGNLANGYFYLGDYSKAVEYGTKAMEIRKTILGENHPDYAASLNILANGYFYLGDYSKAVEYGTKAMEIRKTILGENHPDYAASLNDLANYYSDLGDYSKAVEYGTKAMEIDKTTLGENHPDYAVSLNNLALYYSRLGDYSKAVEYGTKAMEIDKTTLGENHPDYALLLGNLANYFSDLGDYSKALEYGTKAMEIKKEILGENHPGYATSLDDLAGHYSALGDYSKAVEYGTKALEIRKTIFGVNHSSYANSLGNLASYYSDLGDYSKAVEYGTKAMEIKKTILGENHPDFIILLNNLANFYSLLGDYSKGVEYGTKAMEIKKTLLGEKHPDYAASLNNLANCYFFLGDYSKAVEYGTKAMEIRKTILGENHPDYAVSINNLALYYSGLGDYSKAVEYGTKGLETKKAIIGENHPDCSLTLNILANCYSNLDDYSKAAEYTKKNIAIGYNRILSVFSNFPSSQRSLYWKKYSVVFTDIYPALLYKAFYNDYSDLYNQSALFAKGLLLSTTTEMNKLILESGDNEALNMYEELRFKRMELQKLYEKPVAERYLNTDSLNAVADQLEKKLVERSKVYGDYTKKLQTTWKDVQQSLADDELAVEFLSFNVYGTDSTMVAVLTLRKDDKEPKFYPLFELRQLQELSDTVHFVCPDLTGLVWQPLHDELKGIKTIFFSPAGVLHKIGIEYAPGMESYEMFRLSSTREVIDMKSPQRTSEELLARLYGGINYDSSNPTESAQNKTASDASLEYSKSHHRAMIDSLDLRGIQIDYLPGTLREVQNIQKTLTNKHYNATAYTGAKATETSVKSLSGKTTSILHISTHGFYYTESQARKKENLRFLSFEDKHNSSYEDKSLTRSGLLMAGAKLTIDGKDVPIDADDGILTAQEISMLDLRGTDLVVLSACETGRGDIMQGEGVFGLQRGFKKAGVKTILMSLWRVSDVSTEILMTEFYKNISNAKSKRESLRLAQKMVREYKDDEGNLLFQDPHYWAGFVLLD